MSASTVERRVIVALAFGQQVRRASGPSNDSIAQKAKIIYGAESRRRRGKRTPYLVDQWETDMPLKEMGVKADLTVSEYGNKKTEYLSTKEVLDLALQGARQQDDWSHGENIEVILVGHRLHLWFVRKMIRRVWRYKGVTIVRDYDLHMKTVPYDTSFGNDRWWTEGPVVFLIYLPLSLVFGHGLSRSKLEARLGRVKRLFHRS